ncbi:amidase [Pelagibius litoralis]|uniref:Amidase n=2 Tax=Pelagibius litoralis TaxID=374515 RepID=A0A967EVH8_9PROT|nr:amidase [Pelagibius litoralis]
MLAAYASKDLSPVEVTEAMLSRIERVNPIINAFHYVQADTALDAARASESRWANGKPQGLLDGVPTAIKDVLMMKGLPIYRGSAANNAEELGPAESNAPCVERLIEHGAIILGKTTMCDHGMLASGYSSQFGTTRNPWNTSRNCGGSSSGSAAAVAAGIGPVTIGTDIVGSIRNPASFCGLTGHKPSYGRVPCYPQTSPSVCAGPIARDVTDAALLLNVLCLPDARDVSALKYEDVDYTAKLDGSLRGLRIGVLGGLGFGAPLQNAVRERFSAAVDVFAAAGAELVELTPPFDANDADCAERFYQVRSLAELEQLPPGIQARSPVINAWTEAARSYTAAMHYEDYLGTQALRQRLLEVINGFDFLILPTMPVLPYAADNPGLDDGDTFAPWSNTFPFNLTQQPAISVPCGWVENNLPVGLQIVGQRYDDVGVLCAARSFEIASGLPIRPIPEELDLS